MSIQVVKKKDKLSVVLQRGTKGYRGWTPVFGIFSDGARRVQKVVDWIGGEGAKPTIDLYVGATGLVSDIASAVDIRGTPGIDGIDGDDGLNAVMTRSSTSSVAIGTGSKTFAYTSASNLGWTTGMRLRVSYDSANYLEGVITSVSSTSVTLSVDLIAGSGTYANWSLGVAGDKGTTGDDGLNAVMTRSSTSSVTIGTGSKTFAYTSASNLGWTTGMRLRVSYDASNYLEGVITSVSSTSVTITADLTTGSGTYTAWTLGVAGDKGATGSGVPTGGTAGQVLIKQSSTAGDATWQDAMPALAVVTSGTVNLVLNPGRYNICELTTSGSITFNVSSSGRARLLLKVSLGGWHTPALQINGATTNLRWKDKVAPIWNINAGNLYVFDCYTDGTYLDVVNWYLYPAGWTPLTIGNIALWLDATDAASITTVSGNVSQWNDKSGNARHASQATAGQRPSYDSANNRIVFDGTDDRLGGVLPAMTAGSWAIVFDPNSDTAYTLLGTSTLGAGNEWDRFGGDGKSYPARFRSARIETYQNAPTSGVNLLTGLSSSTTWQEWLNGTSPGSVTAAFSVAGGYTIGNGNTLSSNTWFGGRIKEIIISSVAWTTTERQQMEGYLAWKHELTASLPSGHPYKTTFP